MNGSVEDELYFTEKTSAESRPAEAPAASLCDSGRDSAGPGKCNGFLL